MAFINKTMEEWASQDSKGVNDLDMPAKCKIFHEVKVFDKNGKLKGIISEKRIHERHWEVAEKEMKNQRYRSSANTLKEEPEKC